MNITLYNQKPAVRKKARKRVGRGNSAGQGTFGGRGGKGQTARAGGNIRPGFEGGRTTLIMQTPKRRGKGFRSINAESEVIDLNKLNVFSDGQSVTLQTLIARGLAHTKKVKILLRGELKRKLEVAVPVSASAAHAIEKAGGKVILSKAGLQAGESKT